MPKFLTVLLVILAVAAALAVSMHVGLRMVTMASILPLFDEENPRLLELNTFIPQVSLAESCYPLNGQLAQRKRLEELLKTPEKPPAETDSLGLARYAEYARRLDWQDVNFEQAIEEGMRRDPQNALYHYLLAYRWIKLSIEGEYRKNDAPPGTYTYRVKDRALLDRAMEEMATGLRLPLDNRRYDLLSAQLDAMPRPKHWEEQIRETTLLASVLFPEFAKMRELARINGFYLSLLLDEGKRAEAEPFLHTGERIAVQLAEERVPTLIGMLVALAIHSICNKQDAAVCRRFGYTAEAEKIERRFEMISGGMQAWRKSASDKSKRAQFDKVVKANCGILASILLPVFGNKQSITPREMRASRQVETAFFQGIVISLLPIFFVGLIVFSGLKYLRWRVALAGEETPPHDARLSGADWARVLLLGFLLPVGLYAAATSLPVLFQWQIELHLAYSLLSLLTLVLLIVLLTVPTTMAANSIWRRNIAAGIIEVHQPGVSGFMRGLSSVVSLFWATALSRSLLVLPMLAGMALAASVLLPDDRLLFGINWVGHLVILVVLAGLALLPAVWERNHTDCAQHFLALSRAMVLLYAVLALCTAALYPALLGLESHYLRQDKVMTTMRSGETIAFTRAEGRLVLELRAMVLMGARRVNENEGLENARGKIMPE